MVIEKNLNANILITNIGNINLVEGEQKKIVLQNLQNLFAIV